MDSRAKRSALAQQHPKPHPTFTAGGYGAGDPPDPIPNSEVKTRCADGTAGATRWESTAPPANSKTHASISSRSRRGSFRVPGLYRSGLIPVRMNDCAFRDTSTEDPHTESTESTEKRRQFSVDSVDSV